MYAEKVVSLCTEREDAQDDEEQGEVGVALRSVKYTQSVKSVEI